MNVCFLLFLLTSCGSAMGPLGLKGRNLQHSKHAPATNSLSNLATPNQNNKNIVDGRKNNNSKNKDLFFRLTTSPLFKGLVDIAKEHGPAIVSTCLWIHILRKASREIPSLLGMRSPIQQPHLFSLLNATSSPLIASNATIIDELIDSLTESEKLLASEVIVAPHSRDFIYAGGLDEIKTALVSAVQTLQNSPRTDIPSLLQPPTGVLLYGTPGNGKTLLVRNLLHTTGIRLLSVTSATIVSKFYGESERNIRDLFSLARKLSPCVIFFDEVDDLFGARRSGENGGNGDNLSRGAKNQIMQEMDRLSDTGIHSDANPPRVLLIGATNRPYDIDPAILRRFPLSFRVPKPNRSAREDILTHMLAGAPLSQNLPSVVADVARGTEGYSGSDLKNLCQSAAGNAISRGSKIGIDDFVNAQSTFGTTRERAEEFKEEERGTNEADGSEEEEDDDGGGDMERNGLEDNDKDKDVLNDATATAMNQSEEDDDDDINFDSDEEH